MVSKLYFLLFVLLLVVPVSTSSDYNVKICPGCSYYVSCETNSMHPTFDCDDTLLAVYPSSKRDVEPGDIIWFASPRDYRESYQDKKVVYTVHRITRMDYKGCYVTKGDNNQLEDVYHPCFYDIKFKIVGVLYG
jgi:signal peptidase I